jgi:hypothetical protein
MDRASLLSRKLQLFLLLAAFALGTYRVVAGDGWGMIWFLVSAFFAYNYFKFNAVNQAFREVAHGRMEAASRLLAEVKRPQQLSSPDRAYFELASGLVCASRAENARAEEHLSLALAHALRTDNDRALAEAVLSQLLMARDARDEARRVISQAAARVCRPAIAARIKTIRDELAAESPPA